MLIPEKGNGVVGCESISDLRNAEIKIRLLTAASPAVGRHQIKYLVMRCVWHLFDNKQHSLSRQQSLERAITFIGESRHTFTLQAIMTATAQIPGGAMVQQTAGFVLSQLARHRSSWNKETMCPPLIIGVQGPQGAGRYPPSSIHMRSCR